MIIVK